VDRFLTESVPFRDKGTREQRAEGIFQSCIPSLSVGKRNACKNRRDTENYIS